jgi:hypothetical protein
MLKPQTTRRYLTVLQKGEIIALSDDSKKNAQIICDCTCLLVLLLAAFWIVTTEEIPTMIFLALNIVPLILP